MSAFLCNEEHINLIVNAHPDPEKRTKQSFAILLRENLRSLEARYPGREFLEEFKNVSSLYNFEASSPEEIVSKVYSEAKVEEWMVRGYPAVSKTVTSERVAAQIRKACDCFDYQACETSDYYESLAAKFVAEVRDQFTENKKLEEEALWGF